MKTLTKLLHVDKNNHEATPKRASISLLLKSILVIFMLSWIPMLPSCLPLENMPVQGSVVIKSEQPNRYRHGHRNGQHNHRQRNHPGRGNHNQHN
jgi:hypothetical protein